MAAALLVILSFFGVPARADPLAQPCDQVAAKARFEEGLELIKREDWSAGCPKFEASMAICPAVSPQINVARCRAHDGKLAQALAEYQKALVLNRETSNPERRKALDEVATSELAKTTKRVPTLRIIVRVDLPDLMVTRDATIVPPSMFGEPVPVDVGRHVIIASASGFRIERMEVNLAEAASADVELALTPLRTASRPPSVEPGAIGCGACRIGKEEYNSEIGPMAALGVLLFWRRRRRVAERKIGNAGIATPTNTPPRSPHRSTPTTAPPGTPRSSHPR
jgi:hypothetical protein